VPFPSRSCLSSASGFTSGWIGHGLFLSVGVLRRYPSRSYVGFESRKRTDGCPRLDGLGAIFSPRRGEDRIALSGRSSANSVQNICFPPSRGWLFLLPARCGYAPPRHSPQRGQRDAPRVKVAGPGHPVGPASRRALVSTRRHGIGRRRAIHQCERRARPNTAPSTMTNFFPRGLA
jgi:hypothetical protein